MATDREQPQGESYERILDLMERIPNCVDVAQKSLPDRTLDGSIRARNYIAQVETDARELAELLLSRHLEIQRAARPDPTGRLATFAEPTRSKEWLLWARGDDKSIAYGPASFPEPQPSEVAWNALRSRLTVYQAEQITEVRAIPLDRMPVVITRG